MARLRDAVVWLAVAIAVLVPVWFLTAALGTKFGLLDWRVGFGLMTFRLGPQILMGAAGLAALALLLAFVVPPAKGRRIALAALLVPALGLAYGAYVRERASEVPPIHDISTDTADPPGFSEAVTQARAAVPGVNGLDLAEKRVPDAARFGAAAGRLSIDLQRQAYPDLAPIALNRDQGAAFEAARAAAERLGWRIVRADAAAGEIEAEVESFWFGFIDDVAIRVRPTDDGAVVDVRSVSRVGVSDLGANAQRIRAFRAELDPA